VLGVVLQALSLEAHTRMYTAQTAQTAAETAQSKPDRNEQRWDALLVAGRNRHEGAREELAYMYDDSTKSQ
jgi:hypothetical protein